MAALEVVMTTAIILPVLVYMAYLGMQACRHLYSVIGTMVGSSYI